MREEKKRKEKERVYKDIMLINFPNIMKNINIPIKRSTNSKYPHKDPHMHIS